MAGFLFVTGCNPPAFLQAADTPFDSVAISVLLLVAGRRTPRPFSHALSGRNDRFDVPLKALLADPGGIVAFVSSHYFRPCFLPSSGPRHPNFIHHVGKER